MITRLQIKNYRCLRNVDLSLDRLTVLVGRNGAGKSTVVDVLRFLRDSLESGIDNAVIDRGGIKSLRRWSKSRPYQIEIIATAQRGSFWGRYTLKISSAGESFRILLEKAEVGTSESQIQHMFERDGDSWLNLPDSTDGTSNVFVERRPLEATVLALPAFRIVGDFNRLYQELRGNFYTIFPNTLRNPQKAGNERVMAEDGKNFGAILREILKEKQGSRELIAALGRVVEGVNDLKVEAVGSYLVTYLQHSDIAQALDNGEGAVSGESGTSGPWFDLAQESDGTLRLLGMLAALHQKRGALVRPLLLALEEPEIALHPGALPVLRDSILEASRRQQIIITTQSADLLDGFDVDALRVVERVGGVSEVGRINANQREVVKRRLFTAGELIRTEGLYRDKSASSSAPIVQPKPRSAKKVVAGA